MEKPAVIFSEQGFKMFLEFVKDMQSVQSYDKGVDDANAVNSLVRDFYKRDDKPEVSVQADAKYDMEDVCKVVHRFMLDNPGMELNSTDIMEALAINGFEYDKRSIGPIMGSTMKKYPEVQRVEAGVWKYEA